MKLNHLNLTVTDVIATRQLLVKHFGMRPMEEGRENPGFDMVTDENGMVLTLIRFPKGKEIEYPYTFHIGFIQESEEKVNEINQRLKEDGFDVPPPSRQHGSWTFYF